MRKKTLVVVCLLVIALMVASSVPVGAKGKPPKDPPPDDGSNPTGTIYFHVLGSGSGEIYTMNADGSDKTSTDVVFPGKWSMSILKHGGHYWYVGFGKTTGTHPDDTYQIQLWAYRDDDGSFVKLMDDTSRVSLKRGSSTSWA